MRRTVVLILALAVAPAALAKKGHKAHEHGAATLNVAVDGTSVLIGFEAPGDDAFGFEHMPKTPAEKKAVADALALLRGKAGELFQMPAEAGCEVKEATVKAAQEDPSGKAPGEHADVDADYAFTCKTSPAGKTLKLGVFKAFPRVKTLKIQVISGAAQSGMTATGDQDPVKL